MWTTGWPLQCDAQVIKVNFAIYKHRLWTVEFRTPGSRDEKGGGQEQNDTVH
jgi:hypothetical protein